MSTTNADRQRAWRLRGKKEQVSLRIEVDESDLREIALVGYPDAAISMHREAQSRAVSLFLSDAING